MKGDFVAKALLGIWWYPTIPLLIIFIDMGVEEGPARVALSSCGWDINRATEQLFN